MPKISLITTIYNRDRYLERAITSVLSQTFQDFELILFDDGSTDSSVAIAQSFAQKDSRIKLIESPHVGRIPALVAACAQAEGEYSGVIDSDDWIALDCLEKTASVLNNKPQVGMVYSNCMLVDPQGRNIRHRMQNQLPYSRDRLLIDFICFHFRLYRTSLYQQVGGFDPNLDHAEDYDLALKLSEVTEVEFIPETTYYYRRHPASIGALNRIEQTYWTKKVIERSLARTNDRRKIEVLLEPPRFRLNG